MADTPHIEIVLSKYFKPDADRFMYEHPELFEEVAHFMLTNTPPMCWRAAWVIRTAMEDNDERLIPFIDPILEALPNKEDGHQRELMKVLERMGLDDDQESVLYDICVTIWESVRKQPSVRYFAFQQMVKMVHKYPELIHEIQAVTQPQYINSLSPGIKQGVLKLVNKLESNSI